MNAANSNKKKTLITQGFCLDAVERLENGSISPVSLLRHILMFKKGHPEAIGRLCDLARADGFAWKSNANCLGFLGSAPSNINYARTVASWIGCSISSLWPSSYGEAEAPPEAEGWGGLSITDFDDGHNQAQVSAAFPSPSSIGIDFASAPDRTAYHSPVPRPLLGPKDYGTAFLNAGCDKAAVFARLKYMDAPAAGVTVQALLAADPFSATPADTANAVLRKRMSALEARLAAHERGEAAAIRHHDFYNGGKSYDRPGFMDEMAAWPPVYEAPSPSLLVRLGRWFGVGRASA